MNLAKDKYKNMFKVKVGTREGLLEIYDSTKFFRGYIEFNKEECVSVHYSPCKIKMFLPSGNKIETEKYFTNITDAFVFLRNYLNPVGEN